RVGDQPARYVGGPACRIIQDAFLELFQGGRAESIAPERPRGMQQVEVRVIDREIAAYGHDETGADDREIEGLAVVRRARPKRLDLFLEALDELALRPEIQKHVLPQDQFLFGEVSDADQKDVRARSARKPRRLNIEEQHVLPSAR